jgi:hypothetical protein
VILPVQTWLCYLIASIAGVVALVGLYWSLFHDRSRATERCPKCWYEVKGVAARRCPECGREWVHDKELHRTRRRWRWACVFAVVALYAFAAGMTPDVRENGWPRRLPTPVLIWMYPWADGPRPSRLSMNVGYELWRRLYESPDSISRSQRMSIALKCSDILGGDHGKEVVLRAFGILGECGEEARIAFPTLWKLHEHSSDPNWAGWARGTLAHLDAADPKVRAMVIGRVREHPDDTSVGLLNSFPEQSPETEAYFEILQFAVTNGTEAAPHHAAMKLAHIGQLARPCLPALDAAITACENPDFAFYFVVASRCIRGEFASPQHCYAAMLSDPRPSFRATAALQMTQVRKDDRGVGLTEIAHALESPRPDDQPEMREWLVTALLQRGQVAKPLVPLLRRIAQDPRERPSVSKAATNAVEWILEQD